MTKKKESTHSTKTHTFTLFAASVVVMGGAFAFSYSALPEFLAVSYSRTIASAVQKTDTPPPLPPLDKKAYDLKLLSIAQVATSSPWHIAFLTGTSTVTIPGSTTTVTVKKELWPVRDVYPRDSRALLPFNRIVAYYGNFYSTAMGALGQYEPEEMLTRLQAAAAEWQAADPETPVIPAIHYIVMVAQGSAGKDGKYRARMPDSEVLKALELAKKIDGIVFLDFQVGLSDLQSELPIYEEYLKLPQVHVGVDPEFAMQTSGYPPGKVVGTLDATDINWVSEYLAGLVREHDLPPKVLVVHRFTHKMVTNTDAIKTLPEVQIVMDMDGWGPQAKKKGTYYSVIYPEPVQFTGFKIFYKNDTLDGDTLISPASVLELTPQPVYIQYQ